MDLDLIDQLKKKPHVWKQIKNAEKPLRFLPDFFSEFELETLRDFKDRAYLVKENQRFRQGTNSKKPSDIMAWPDEELKRDLCVFFEKKFREVLSEDLPKDKKMKDIRFEFAFHQNYHPYGLHTDAGYDNEEVIFRQGIIPLAWDPSEARSHTVIMKQRCHFSSSFPAKSQYRPEQRPRVDSMKKEWIEEFNQATEFDPVQLKKYWIDNELYSETLKGFEVDHAFEWKLGDTIVWDRGQIHCSSDFDLFGLNYKVGLMWVSSLV